MRSKILALSLIILALSVVRTAFPEAVNFAREKLRPVAQYGESLAQGFLTIGKRLTGNGDAVYTWEKDDAPAESQTHAAPPESAPAATPSASLEGFDFEAMVSSNLMGIYDAPSPFYPPESEDPYAGYPPSIEPAAEEEASAISAMQVLVDDFLARQAAVTDLELPESICTEAVMIDFEYAAPCSVDYTSTFGYRLHPIYNDMRFHYGTDFQAFTGDVISAFADGTVIAAQEFDGYGQTVILDHGNGFTSLYAHCSRIDVALGDTVAMGQTIGLVGATGNVTGPHLHFELQKDGLYLNPEFYL